MQIRFVYSSNALQDSDHVEAVLRQFPVQCQKHQTDQAEYLTDVSDDHIVTVRMDIDFSVPGCGDDRVQLADRTIQVFADLSRELGVDWNVGHELDPHLGSIAKGQPCPKLANEVRMALNVAQSLAGMIVDDEFVEPDAVFDEPAFPADNGLANDETWTGLLESEHPFIRFPEFE